MHFFNIELLNRFVIGPKRLYNFLSEFVMIKRFSQLVVVYFDYEN